MSRTTLTLAALPLLLLGAALPACRRSPQDAARQVAAAPFYQCPMHPQITSDRPGSCPICGMDLVKVERDAPAAQPAPAPAAASSPATAASGVPGRALVTLSSERRQLLGVRSEEVHHSRLERTIRTVGRIAPDERRLHHVHTKFEGYVERLYVDFTGALVRRGQPLLSIYSPELVATQQEYLLALKARERLGASPVAATSRGSAELLEAARQRLLLWDIHPREIEALKRSGEVERTLNLYSDVTGYVTQKNVVHGMRVMPQDTLFDIADLSRLWVLADVYESDLPSVSLGMEGEVSVPYLPGKRWTGPVTYVAPTVEAATRTVKVRLEVDNRSGELKPDMYADVVLRPSLGTGLIVPESAVIATGDRSIVFVDLGDGRFEPREVRLGPKVEGGVQALAGLEDAERVVVSANFLLDSESSLKAAIGAVTPLPSPPAVESRPAVPEPAATPDPHAAHRH